MAVIEVGLGGRLDSTNVVHAARARRDLDRLRSHGVSRRHAEAIAGEKAGIFKPGVPAVVGETRPAHSRSAGTARGSRQAPPGARTGGRCAVEDISSTGTGTSFSLGVDGSGRRLCHAAHRHVPGGQRGGGARHAGCGGRPLAAMRRATPSGALADAHWRAAFITGAHSCSTWRTMRTARDGRANRSSPCGLPRPVTAVVTVLRDKDWRGMLRRWRRDVDRFVLTLRRRRRRSARGRWTRSAEFAGTSGWTAERSTISTARLRAARDGAATVLVTGSFHTVGDAMARLRVSLGSVDLADGPGRIPRISRFLPAEFAERAYIFDAWRRVVRRYAFVEYDGPPLEPLDLYTKKSGDEIVGPAVQFHGQGRS